MDVSGWGRYPRAYGRSVSFRDTHALRVELSGTKPTIARGMGRSYGDSAIAKKVISTDRFNRFLMFDEKHGRLTCQAGVTLADLVDVFLPRGWFLPVTPGTKFVTVGGAIASDVHGKNHHKAGCFSNFVLSLSLMLPSGRVRTCSREENSNLFHATCGGMGLTGVILHASLQLKPVQSAFIEEKTQVARNIYETFDLFEKYQSAEYSVAWTDAMAKGLNCGRSVLMTGRHTALENRGLHRRCKVSIPVDMPGFFLNRSSGMIFNSFYFNRQGPPKTRIRHVDSFFYPLDIVENWNRLYGRKGLIQYQFVLPKSASLLGCAAVLNKAQQAGQPSFLTVLKLLGPKNDNYLSFPLEGYTMALDFAVKPALFRLLNELDRIVFDHGGRLYLSKDARMPVEMLESGYPKLDAFLDIRQSFRLKGRIESRQSLRLGI